MIDVMKRLAELDAANPNVIKESASLEECGPMGMMDSMGGMEKPSTPASMNITAGSGDELANMLATIMQLAGVKQDAPGELDSGPGDEMMTAEPAIEIEPMSGGDAMRSMMDKLNPMDDEGGDDVSKSHGDLDNDGDHDMADHEKEKEDDEEETDESWDNSPNPETEKYGAFQAHGDMDKNPAGGGNVPKDHDSRPRVRNQPTATFESLMDEYQKFVTEGEGKTMSRAAKGNEKYGKDGMKALAKAGKEGKDLDKVRDKYNKYD